MEVAITVTQEVDGGYVDKGVNFDITQADAWDELRGKAREAVDAYFFDQPKPASILLE